MANTLKYTDGTGPAFVDNTTTFTATFNLQSLGASRNYTFPNATGTIALTSDLSAYAPLASPVFTGTPEAPTPDDDTTATQIVTTDFCQGGVTIAAATPGDTTDLGVYAGTAGLDYVFTHSGTMATYTLRINPGALNGQHVRIVFNCIVTALTLDDGLATWGTTGLAQPTTLAANTPFIVAWDKLNTEWVRVA